MRSFRTLTACLVLAHAFHALAAVQKARSLHKAHFNPLIAFGSSGSPDFASNGTLQERQVKTCVNPGYVPCAGPGCCPPNLECQPRGCCEPGKTECATTEYCYEPGYYCCLDAGGGSCPEGTDCCVQDCCTKGEEICCGGWCCPVGSECGSSEGQCLVETTSTSTSTSISTSRSRAPIPTFGTSIDYDSILSDISGLLSDFTSLSLSLPTFLPSVSAIPSITPAPSATPTPGPSPTYSTPPASCSYPSLSNRQNDDCNLPVFNYPFVESLTDDTCRSMCLGMGGANEVIYEYGGPGFGTANRTPRCKGCCTGVLKSSGTYAGEATECDEQPPASVKEGGAGAHIACISAEQNRIHGRLLLAFYLANSMKAGDRFINRVDGLDCGSVTESELQPCGNSGGNKLFKRQMADAGTTYMISTVRSVNSTMGMFKLLTSGLGDLEAGTYTTSIQLPAETAVEDIYVIDGSGFSYGQASLDDAKSENGATVQFTLPGFVPGVALVARTSKDQDAIRYEFTPGSTPSGAASAATSRWKDMMNGMLTGALTIIASLLSL